MYDSTSDTQRHIAEVQSKLLEFIWYLGARAKNHDASKLESPEKETFDEFTPRLRELTYGGDEYKQCLGEMSEAIRHHYDHNPHHPEHYSGGINEMSLLDIIEMLADWSAAVTRHADGDLMKSLVINKERFGISDQLFLILKHTAVEMGWLVE